MQEKSKGDDSATLHDTLLNETSPVPSSSPLTPRRRFFIYFATVLSMLMIGVDQTSVSTGLPSIITDLDGFPLYSWVMGACMLASTIVTPIVGRLGDLFGRKIFFLAGQSLFVLGSGLAAVSGTMTLLIAARAIQGLGVGATFPILLAIIGETYGPRERSRYQGICSAVNGIGTALGPLIGGVLNQAFGWESIFVFNVGLGLVTIAYTFIAVPWKLQCHCRTALRRVDFLGMTAVVVTFVPFLLAITWGGAAFGWGSPVVIVMWCLSGAGLGALVLVEWRLAPEPAFPLRLFRSRVFATCVACAVLMPFGYIGVLSYLSLFARGVLGLTSADTGLVLLPMMSVTALFSVLGGQLLARTGRFRLVALGGFLVSLPGVYLYGTMGPQTPVWLFCLYQAIVGVGLGPLMSVFITAIQNAVAPAELGVATSTVSFARLLGQTFSITVIGTCMQGIFARDIDGCLTADVLALLPQYMRDNLHKPNVLVDPAFAEQLRADLVARYGVRGEAAYAALTGCFRGALAEGLAVGFFVGAGVATACMLVALLLKARGAPRPVMPPSQPHPPSSSDWRAGGPRFDGHAERATGLWPPVSSGPVGGGGVGWRGLQDTPPGRAAPPSSDPAPSAATAVILQPVGPQPATAA
ncbi:Multidrug resistance-associated protein [Paratrimastix pyriformis]|uniref:Multidrug resistance-associated protein n=1 Tax=Paratrimastix pyriformis TaxID=342808 RepID=A0ABQ8UKB0_9EUKA|nr:Multidrug resistance-associated protein [Paratrimastix pyriformis]